MFLSGCLEDPAVNCRLVPQTVDQSPQLPSILIEVAGYKRLIHCRTFGDSSNPVLFIMPGSLSDMRAYLPLQELKDQYFVVMWDQRGNGLSERVTEAELSYEAMVEEIQAVKKHFSPSRPITLMGHSWSAVFAANYLGKHPSNVSQAILIEPFGLNSDIMKQVDIPINLATEGYLDMMYASDYLTPKDHETLDYQMLAVLQSGVRDYFCDTNHLPPWPVWRVGGYALIAWEKHLLKGNTYNFDFTSGLMDFPGEVLLVGSSCSPVGYQFQQKYHQSLFQNARVLKIENSGHRIITEQYEALIGGLHEFLQAYRNASG